MNNPNNWASIKIIGGNANVLKNAVAPAIRNGSFFLNNTTASRRLFIRTDNSYRNDLLPTMIAAKVCSQTNCHRRRLGKIERLWFSSPATKHALMP
jgi:hypothetical protein